MNKFEQVDVVGVPHVVGGTKYLCGGRREGLGVPMWGGEGL